VSSFLAAALFVRPNTRAYRPGSFGRRTSRDSTSHPAPPFRVSRWRRRVCADRRWGQNIRRTGWRQSCRPRCTGVGRSVELDTWTPVQAVGRQQRDAVEATRSVREVARRCFSCGGGPAFSGCVAYLRYGRHSNCAFGRRRQPAFAFAAPSRKPA
jgi:hypothetical protein